ncbi:MAG: DUF4175 family protein [Sandaracinaceae bacterium]|nr:DUF4175 family protein [Sandaracinaceae bacterium]
MSGPTPTVARYLGRLRRRAATIHALRALVGAAGAAGVVFALGAFALGPLGEAWAAGIAWLLVLSSVAAVAAWAWRSFRPLRGAGAARLLVAVAPELPSATRSAYELELSPPTHASASLVRAHADRVARELRFITPGHVVPWRELADRAVGLGLVGLALAAVVVTSERGAAGAYALVHPGERDDAGERVAVAFSGVSARLTYPSYLARAPVEVLDPTVLEVPRGTSVEIRAAARLDATAASLRTGDATTPMERDTEGRWFGRIVARTDSELVLRLREPSGDWVRDATPRTIHALVDEAPAVTLVDPLEDLVVTDLAEIPIRWEATDDVGVAAVDLVVRGVDAEEHRRRLSANAEGAMPESAEGATTLDLALHALARGESLSFWVEARDGDVVSGPNITRSRELTVTLASEATRREQGLDRLEALLDTAIHTLADRLERPVPEVDTEAVDRFEALRGPTDGFLRAIRDQIEHMREEGQFEESDVGLLREMTRRVRRLAHEERVAHGRTVASLTARTRIDERFGTELENDVLTIDDLLAEARVQDAAEIARELEQIRREMQSLLSELLRTDSPEARRELLAAVARAQARMRELMQRLARMGTNVPQEFMNRGEMPTGETTDALESLREAVQRGDLSRAQEIVDQLRSQIDQIARQLGQTEEELAEARGFGPRDRAMANAMEALGNLETEQQRLANRGTERRSRAARRALEAIGGRDNRIGRRLSEDARAVRETLEQVDRNRLAGFEQDGFDRAVQRLRDTEEALRAGDLGEARAMSEAAQEGLSGLSRDLDLSALMFPGHEGETAEDADRARQANRALGSMRRQLDEALPNVAEHLQPEDRGEMRGDLGDQRQATEAAGRLASQLAEGPDGTPLSEDAAREVRDAAEAMRVAERALGQSDPLESARAQEEAARRLTELRERLEQQQQQNQGGGGSGSSSPDFDRPVDIPNADDFEGPMEMRRRLLDAMREAPPSGYEDAVRRYYEGLLR